MDELLKIENLQVFFKGPSDFLGRPSPPVRAVDGVSFSVQRGETFALVGESGCGKTTTGRAILRAYKPIGGRILYKPEDQIFDLASMTRKEIRPLRRSMQMVFQDPFGSLNPRMTVAEIIAEPLLVSGLSSREAREARVRELLVQCGLKPEFMRRYPHAFSGGQRQRIVIARALALKPKLVIADEPVSSLDVSVQAQILNLLSDLKDIHRLTYIFVAHDLEVVRHIADTVAVMYAGRLMEVASTQQLFENPLHPYTQALLSATPKPIPRRQAKRQILGGEVPNPANLPSGCVFHTRCPLASAECRERVPVLRPLSAGRSVYCHKVKEK